ncbi:hypothetical protein R6Q59_010168 [Mikania micrantha]
MRSFLIVTHICLLVSKARGVALSQQRLLSDSDDIDSPALRKLKTAVGDRLIYPLPIGKPCYGPHGSTSQACIDLNGTKMNDIWTSNHSGGFYYNNWASCQATNEACTLPIPNDTTTVPSHWNCSQGSVPIRAIDVQSMDTLSADIEAAFDYVRATNDPFVVRNTGHDWKGRSTAPGGLALWTHHLQHPKVPIRPEENFVPKGCKLRPGELGDTVFHFGPGQQWGGAYEFAKDRGYSLVGGTCPSVGIAGWLQGGGHSPLTPVYGMGVDNLRQVEIVTPRHGKIIANECLNNDTFFAIRGGGGGSWGVITSIAYRALPVFELQDFHCTVDKLSRNDISGSLDLIANQSVLWSQQGWGGYIKFLPNGQLSFELVNPKITKVDAEKHMQPVIDFAQTKGVHCTIKTQESWYAYFDEHLKDPENHPALWSQNPTSRLLSNRSFEINVREDLLEGLLNLYDDKLVFWLMFVAPTNFDHTTKSALHPTWKEAALSVRANTRWDQFEDQKKEIKACTHFKQLHESFSAIRNLAPEMGISISESEIWEESHEQSFWGTENYARLLDVKKRVDPDNIMSNYHAVGWNSEAERYRCYPKL